MANSEDPAEMLRSVSDLYKVTGYVTSDLLAAELSSRLV